MRMVLNLLLINLSIKDDKLWTAWVIITFRSYGQWLWGSWHFHSPIGAHQFHKRQFKSVLLRYSAGTKASNSMISTNRQNDRHKKWSDTGPWHKQAYRQESKRCRHTTCKSLLPPGIDPTACKTDILTATPRRSSLHYTTFHLVLRNSTWRLLLASLPASC